MKLLILISAFFFVLSPAHAQSIRPNPESEITQTLGVVHQAMNQMMNELDQRTSAHKVSAESYYASLPAFKAQIKAAFQKYETTLRDQILSTEVQTQVSEYKSIAAMDVSANQKKILLQHQEMLLNELFARLSAKNQAAILNVYQTAGLGIVSSTLKTHDRLVLMAPDYGPYATRWKILDPSGKLVGSTTLRSTRKDNYNRKDRIEDLVAEGAEAFRYVFVPHLNVCKSQTCVVLRVADTLFAIERMQAIFSADISITLPSADGYYFTPMLRGYAYPFEFMTKLLNIPESYPIRNLPAED